MVVGLWDDSGRKCLSSFTATKTIKKEPGDHIFTTVCCCVNIHKKPKMIILSFRFPSAATGCVYVSWIISCDKDQESKHTLTAEECPFWACRDTPSTLQAKNHTCEVFSCDPAPCWSLTFIQVQNIICFSGKRRWRFRLQGREKMRRKSAAENSYIYV